MGFISKKLIIAAAVITLAVIGYANWDFIKGKFSSKKFNSETALMEHESINSNFLKDFSAIFNSFNYITSPTRLDLYSEEKIRTSNLEILKNKYDNHHQHILLLTQAHIDFINREKELALYNLNKSLEHMYNYIQTLKSEGVKISNKLNLSIASETAIALNLLGIIERESGNYLNSLKSFTLAMHSNPADPGVISNRGFLISTAFKNNRLAIKDHNFAIEISNNSPKILYAKAFIMHLDALEKLKNNKDQQEIIAQLNNAIKLYKETAREAATKGERSIYLVYKSLVHSSLAAITNNNSEIDIAIHDLEEAITLRSSCVNCNYFLGYLYANRGEFAKAANMFTKIKNFYSNDLTINKLIINNLTACANHNQSYFNLGEIDIADYDRDNLYNKRSIFRIDLINYSNVNAENKDIGRIIFEEPDNLIDYLSDKGQKLMTDLLFSLDISWNEHYCS